MKPYYESVTELKEEQPKAWDALFKYLSKNENLDFEFEEENLKNIEYLVDLICEVSIDCKESIDSYNVINEYYTEEIDGFVFSVTGSSYRKDRSVCDEIMDLFIYVKDINLEKIKKEEKKSMQIAKNISDWTKFINESSTEQLLDKLQNVKLKKKNMIV